MKNLVEFDYLKDLERNNEITIPSDQYIIVRIDGRGFSKLTKRCEKPFDPYIKSAMKAVAMTVMERFNPTYSYGQSDEITFVWEPRLDRNGTNLVQHPFNGRTLKLASLVAATASFIFHEEMVRTTEDFSVKSYQGFDARIYPGDQKTAHDSLMFRFWDCHTNVYQGIAQTLWSHKELHGVTVKQIQTKLDEIGFDPFEKFGVENMKGLFLFKETNPETGRTEIIESNGSEMVTMITGVAAKY